MQDNKVYTNESRVNGDESFIEERKEMIEELFEKTEKYIQTNVQILKLRVMEKVAAVVSSLVSNLAVVLVVFFFLMMMNIGVAMWLGSLMAQPYHGFMVVAGFYGVIAVLLLIFGKSLIKKSISNSILEDLLK